MSWPAVVEGLTEGRKKGGPPSSKVLPRVAKGAVHGHHSPGLLAAAWDAPRCSDSELGGFVAALGSKRVSRRVRRLGMALVTR